MSGPFKLIVNSETPDDAIDELITRLAATVYEYVGRVHVVAAIGALEIVKATVMQDALED